MEDAVVLGAGLTGAAAALELARHGVAVTLLDQDHQPFNRASLRNEGKIHLGLIYANDPSLGTARLQLEGALTFRALLSRWIGAAANRLPRSTPFVYLVARDSLLAPDELATHYSRVQAAYEERRSQLPECDYLGTRPARLWTPAARSALASHFRQDRLAAAFETAELAIDTASLATAFRLAIAEARHVTFLPGRRVKAVERSGGGFTVEGDGASGTWRLHAGQVINALWDHRLGLDAAMGLTVPPGWVHRLKYRVIATLPDRLLQAPSATIVLGRYGDVVVRESGTAYLSWYPAALKGWSHDLVPPSSWDAPCRGVPDPAEANRVAADVLAALDAWYPGIADCTPLLVDAGAIVAYGRTDVNDPGSALHDRTQVGVRSVDGYHSVDPGKLTTAPLFARMAAAHVLGEREEALA